MFNIKYKFDNNFLLQQSIWPTSFYLFKNVQRIFNFTMQIAQNIVNRSISVHNKCKPARCKPLYTHITGFQQRNNYSFNWRLIGFFERRLLFGSDFKQLSNDSPNRKRASLSSKSLPFHRNRKGQILEGLNYEGKYSKESPRLTGFHLSCLRADQTLES